MKSKPITEAHLSERVVLRPGDKIRARGGPTYKGKRIGDPGVYEVRSVLKQRGRIFAECARLDRIGKSDARVPSGTYILFISGKPFRSKLVDEIINRPYRVSKVRK